jgi:hypothetical protein
VHLNDFYIFVFYVFCGYLTPFSVAQTKNIPVLGRIILIHYIGKDVEDSISGIFQDT